MSPVPECRLTSKGFQWAKTGHPWVYRDDLALAGGDHGDVVRVVFDGACLGLAFLSVRSKIALRWIERTAPGAEAPQIPDHDYWRRRISAAHARRTRLAERTNAYRVVHDAADGIPGLIIDRYGPVAVVQTTIAGTERLLPLLAEELPGLLKVEAVFARNDLGVREKEGLTQEVRSLSGECPERVWVHEIGPSGRIEFSVAPRTGQKTGAYLDQRENRWRAAELARGRMLDAFSNAGLFGLHASRRVSEVVSVDTSEPALALCEEAARRNGVSNIRATQKNVFDYLKEACKQGERFETIVVDPPAFAKSKAEVPAAVRGYREINRRAMELLAPAGVLVTCSCSYNLSEDEFLDVLRGAASDSRSELRLLERRTQGADHPILLNHPQSSYLKCIVLEKTGGA